MNKRTKILSTFAAVAVFSLGAVALAGPGGHGHGGPHRLLKLIEKLDLTETQRKLLDGFRAEAKKKHHARHAQRIETKRALADEIEKPQADATRLKALADQHVEAMRQNLHDRIDDFAKLHQTLTPAQKQELARQLRQMAERGKKHRSE